MKKFERFRAFFGERISITIISYIAIIGICFLPFFRSYAEIYNGDLGFIAYSWLFFCFGKILYSVFRKEKEESFSNIKFFYTVTIIIMSGFTVLYYATNLIVNYYVLKNPVNIIKVAQNLEVVLLYYALIPFCLYLPTYRSFSIAFIVSFIITSFKNYIFKEPTLLKVIILAVAIPLIFSISTVLILRLIKNRLEIINNSEINETKEKSLLYDRLDKAYRIYTGKKLDYLIKIYGLMNIALFIISLIFAKSGSFTSANVSIQTAVIISSMMIFSTSKCEPSDMFTRKSCYFLSIKNRLGVYKDFYFTTYFIVLLNLLVFSVLTYVAGGICHILPENYYLYLLADIVSLIMIFGIVPFFLTSKSVGLMMLKNMLIVIAFIPLKIFIVKLHWSLFIVGAIAGIVLIICSNKYWIKRITGLYEEI